MGGEFTYQPKWDTIGFGPQPHGFYKLRSIAWWSHFDPYLKCGRPTKAFAHIHEPGGGAPLPKKQNQQLPKGIKPASWPSTCSPPPSQKNKNNGNGVVVFRTRAAFCFLGLVFRRAGNIPSIPASLGPGVAIGSDWVAVGSCWGLV